MPNWLSKGQRGQDIRHSFKLFQTSFLIGRYVLDLPVMQSFISIYWKTFCWMSDGIRLLFIDTHDRHMTESRDINTTWPRVFSYPAVDLQPIIIMIDILIVQIWQVRTQEWPECLGCVCVFTHEQTCQLPLDMRFGCGDGMRRMRCPNVQNNKLDFEELNNLINN